MKLRYFKASAYLKYIVASALFSMWMAFPVYAVGEIAFEDTTARSGIAYSGPSFGASWGDFNGDGWPDLWTGNHYNPDQPPGLWLNLGDGTFLAGTIPVEVDRGDLHGASWADYDNDGDQDILIQAGALYGTSSDPNRFFENQNGILVEKASLVGLDYPLGRGRTPLWLDWNNDGNLDVILTNATRADGQAPTALFSQDNNGNFVDSSAATGFHTAALYNDFAHLITWESEDTGTTDPVKIPLVFVHTFGYPDWAYALYNSSLIPVQLPVPASQWNTRDVAVGDFNGDLRSDIYLARTWPENAALDDTLLLQDANGFIDSSFLLANIPATPCESAAAADFDNDMDIDLYLVCLGPVSNTPNILLENMGNGVFLPVPQAGGAEGSNEGRGESVAAADYDRDGYMDLLITNGRGGDLVNDGPTQLFRNLAGNNHWLEIDLEGVISNRDAIGARIFASAGGVTQLREQIGGMHRYSQHHQRVHFGLAGNTQVDELTVEWPSGLTHKLTNLPVDQIINVAEELPVPAITANGNQDSLTINQNENLRINIALENNGIVSESDWWLFVDSAQYGEFEFFLYQGSFFTLASTEIINTTLPSGNWTFRFVADIIADGVLSPENAFETTVSVEIL